MTDVVEDPEKNADYLAKVAKEKVPVLLVINKIDLLKDQAQLNDIVSRWQALLPNAEIFPTSATEHFNVSNLMQRIVELLPVSPPFFGKDALTDKPARFFVTEIIREKILLNYDKEVPYSTEVIVEKFDEKDGAIHILSLIHISTVPAVTMVTVPADRVVMATARAATTETVLAVTTTTITTTPRNTTSRH